MGLWFLGSLPWLDLEQIVFLFQWLLENVVLLLHFFLSSHHFIQEDQTPTGPSNPNPDGPVSTTSTQQTVPNTTVQADKMVPNKSLLDWLRQQSDYTLEIPGFGTVSTNLTF